MYYIGIDNGTSGSVCVLNEEGKIELHIATPVKQTINYTKKLQKIKRIDIVNLNKILNKISFVDKIIFGKLNYNCESKAFENNEIFYEECAQKVIEFCKKRNIDYHIKYGTRKRYNKETEILFKKIKNDIISNKLSICAKVRG